MSAYHNGRSMGKGARELWGQRGRIDLPQPPGRGPNGRRFCRMCHEEVGPGRLSWCGDECSQLGWLKKSWPYMRQHIERRDKVCRLCGTDHPGYHFRGGIWQWRRLGYGHHGPWLTPPSYAWEVDHIQPVSEGGTDDPDNLRLLCRACHKRVTAEWRRSKAKRRNGSMAETGTLAAR